MATQGNGILLDTDGLTRARARVCVCVCYPQSNGILISHCI
jgi:hypothetical protein